MNLSSALNLIISTLRVLAFGISHNLISINHLAHSWYSYFIFPVSTLLFYLPTSRVKLVSTLVLFSRYGPRAPSLRAHLSDEGAETGCCEQNSIDTAKNKFTNHTSYTYSTIDYRCDDEKKLLSWFDILVSLL